MGAHVSRPQLILGSDEIRLNYKVLAHLLASWTHKVHRPYYGLWAGFTYVCACVFFFLLQRFWAHLFHIWPLRCTPPWHPPTKHTCILCLHTSPCDYFKKLELKINSLQLIYSIKAAQINNFYINNKSNLWYERCHSKSQTASFLLPHFKQIKFLKNPCYMCITLLCHVSYSGHYVLKKSGSSGSV